MDTRSLAAEAADGRKLRSVRMRAALTRAALELVRETGSLPGFEAVAERAQASRRSAFRHFTDMTDLIVAVTQLQRSDIQTRFPERDLSGIDRSARVRAVAQRLGRIHEFVTPMFRLAQSLRDAEPLIDRLLQDDDAAYHARLSEIFAPDLTGETPGARIKLFRAMVAVSSWHTWQSLRRDQQLTVLQAREVVEHLLNALLDRPQKKSTLEQATDGDGLGAAREADQQPVLRDGDPSFEATRRIP